MPTMWLKGLFFIASDDAAWVTEIDLFIDGGYLAQYWGSNCEASVSGQGTGGNGGKQVNGG